MIPLIIFWKEGNENKSSNKGGIAKTFKDIKSNKKLLLFLFSYWIYIDGVATNVIEVVACVYSVVRSSSVPFLLTLTSASLIYGNSNVYGPVEVLLTVYVF